MEECNDMKTLNAAAAKYNSISLIVRILCGLVIGAVLALTVPGLAGSRSSAPCLSVP